MRKDVVKLLKTCRKYLQWVQNSVFKGEISEANYEKMIYELNKIIKKEDGSSKTYYYSPSEKEFSEFINLNLQKKWKALYNEDCKYNLRIFPVDIKK